MAKFEKFFHSESNKATLTRLEATPPHFNSRASMGELNEKVILEIKTFSKTHKIS